jgi:rfaE bifunctional protein nucleotidyltransferase chain/domain
VSVTASKVVSLEELAEVVATRKAAGESVVHCHGVFDLIHPGHIRHLELARAEGDVLVVTVTPDHLVNKGPGRPVFNERLRAETLAAMACVDYVAVNRWPTAVEAIELLRPDIYVKGDEYERPENDLTGKIGEEEAAVVAAGGRLHYTHDVTFSSSHLLNAHFAVYSEDADAFLSEFRERHDPDEIIGVLRAIRGLRIAVVGDAIIDSYHFCEPYGMASKSASIAARSLHEEPYAGGAMAIANHLAGFCDDVSLITCLGRLDSREEFIRSNLKSNVRPSFVFRPDAPTTVKRRYVSGFLMTKLFEIVSYNDAPLPTAAEEELGAVLEESLGGFDLVVVADFGHGMIGNELVNVIVRESSYLALNAQTNAANYGFNPVTRYPRADYVCIDEREGQLAFGDRNAAAGRIIETLSDRLGTSAFTMTRGTAGATVSGASGRVDVPVFSHEVIDTVGAGDAFFALTAPCAQLGATPDVIGFVGNAVGALAVQIVGNKSSVEPATLFKFVTSLLK